MNSFIKYFLLLNMHIYSSCVLACSESKRLRPEDPAAAGVQKEAELNSDSNVEPKHAEAKVCPFGIG